MFHLENHLNIVAWLKYAKRQKKHFSRGRKINKEQYGHEYYYEGASLPDI